MTARIYDQNGWFRVKRNPLSKVGIFPYLGSSIGAPPERANDVFEVLRPEEELSDPECINSFRTVPLIDDHEMLGAVEAGLTPVERKGVGGVTGDEVIFDGDTLYSNVTVFSEALARQINNGKKELSCGYRCEYDFTPGTWNGKKYDVVQRKMRGNHVAVVSKGRMGPDVAVLDHQFTYDHVDVQELQSVLDKDTQAAIDAAVTKGIEGVTKAFDGLDEKIAKAVADAMPAALAEAAEKKAEGEDEDKEAEKADEKALDAQIVAAVAKVQTAADARVKALEDQIAKMKPTVDAADAAHDAADKADLIKKLTPHVGAFDAVSGPMTVSQVVAYGLDKLNIKGVAAGAERATLDGYLLAKPVPAPVAMDAKPVTGSAIDKYINGEVE